MATLEELRDARLKKLELLKSKGIDAYPADAHPTHTLAEAVSCFAGLESSKASVTLVGRLMSLRSQGGLIFFDLFDGTGKFQALIMKKEGITEDMVALFDQTVDIGDFVEVKGTVFVTKRGQQTIEVTDWRMLSKTLRPLPEKWSGLQDVEERFRRRYLDALMSDEVRARFTIRSKVVRAVRNFLDDRGFLEFETPILQPLAGGATAEPFKTHHNALNIDLFLRIAPELYLKELLVAGFPKVYELGRLFRNEGIDQTHNPEFTTVEFYEAFAEAAKHRVLMEELVKHVVQNTLGTSIVVFEEKEIDFEKPFSVVTYEELLAQYTGIKNIFSLSRDDVAAEAEKQGIKVDPGHPWEKIIDNIYKKLCRPQLVQPTFIIDYPIQFSPLAKQKTDDKKMIDRFQLVVAGYEIVNAFSELNDPLEQVRRFQEQENNKKAGDAEAQPNDVDYVEAMEHGMPPAGGAALSIDRITMILTNTRNIKEVIFFPTMRPR